MSHQDFKHFYPTWVILIMIKKKNLKAYTTNVIREIGPTHFFYNLLPQFWSCPGHRGISEVGVLCAFCVSLTNSPTDLRLLLRLWVHSITCYFRGVLDVFGLSCLGTVSPHTSLLKYVMGFQHIGARGIHAIVFGATRSILLIIDGWWRWFVYFFLTF